MDHTTIEIKGRGLRDELIWLDVPSEDGRLLMSPHSLDLEAVEKALSDSLEKVRRYRACLSMMPKNND